MVCNPLTRVTPGTATGVALSCQDNSVTMCNKLVVRAEGDDVIYLGTKAAMNPTTGDGIYSKIYAGTAEVIIDEQGGNTIQVGAWFVLATNGTDVAYGGAFQR